MSGFITEESAEYLRLFHGIYNFTVFCFFLYQAVLGFKIRRTRLKKGTAVSSVRRHRKLGPYLAFFGPTGYLIGLAIIYLDKGEIATYPLHLAVGTLIVLIVITTYLVSRKIRAGDALRVPHLILGLCIIFFYIIQILLGISILL